MASPNKFNSFPEAVAEKQHNLASDSFLVFFSNSAPVATNTQLSDITQISYTNLSSRALTVSSSSQTSGTYKWVVNDITVTASGTVGPFRYIGIVNDTSTNDLLVNWYDYGSSITLNSGDTFTTDFDGTNGVLTIA